ncbi:serine threonine protein kinase CMGC group [Microbotryomycetes sp. JL201]|nr:serine threonine protein kinase CMGC group [Microbotryomycetes sp. JL201]
MSSQVVTRPAGDSSAASRSTYTLAAASNGGAAVASTSTAPQRHSNNQVNGTSAYASRRQPAGAPPPPTMFRVDKVNLNGRDQEVLTIMDTPEPGDEDYAATSTLPDNVYRARHQDDHPGPSKRRKSDGAHISDNPYVASSSTQGKKWPAPAKAKDHDPPPTSSKTSTKRKHADQAQDTRASQKAKVADDDAICDKDGHYIVRPETLLSGEYRIIKQLGQGTFGKVVAAEHIKTRQHVAIKIIRNVDKYREAAKMEIAVLKKLEKGDSVFDFLKENSYAPFPLSHVQSFARQLLSSVAFVHRMQFIHTDLKPENILLEDGRADIVPAKRHKNRKILKNTSIRLIDFGSATGAKDYHASVVSTRHYRAPEIILGETKSVTIPALALTTAYASSGLGWSFPCDAWSIGCILVEFMTGEALFQTHENLEHLAMMVRVFGHMPKRFAQRAERAALANGHQGWFRPGQNGPIVNFPREDTSSQSRKFVSGMKMIQSMIPHDNSRAALSFVDLVMSLLKWDPADRITPAEALQHDFFKMSISDVGSASYMPPVPEDVSPDTRE